MGGRRGGRGTGLSSAPDVSLCSETVAEELQWDTRRELGSDHHPILITRRDGVQEEGSGTGELAWDWKRARWGEYQKEIREAVKEVNWDGLSVGNGEKEFRSIVMQAARKWVGKRMRKVGGELVSSEVRELMAKRDALKKEETVDWDAVTVTEAGIKEKVKVQKEERWREMLKKGASTAKMWPIVRRARRGQGKPGTEGEIMKEEGGR